MELSRKSPAARAFSIFAGIFFLLTFLASVFMGIYMFTNEEMREMNEVYKYFSDNPLNNPYTLIVIFFILCWVINLGFTIASFAGARNGSVAIMSVLKFLLTSFITISLLIALIKGTGSLMSEAIDMDIDSITGGVLILMYVILIAAFLSRLFLLIASIAVAGKTASRKGTVVTTSTLFAICYAVYFALMAYVLLSIVKFAYVGNSAYYYYLYGKAPSLPAGVTLVVIAIAIVGYLPYLFTALWYGAEAKNDVRLAEAGGFIPYDGPVNPYEPAPNAYQPAPNPYQPAPNAYQPAPNPYQPAPEAPQPAANPYQPAPNAYQPTPNPYQPAPEAYQPAPNPYAAPVAPVVNAAPEAPATEKNGMDEFFMPAPDLLSTRKPNTLPGEGNDSAGV